METLKRTSKGEKPTTKSRKDWKIWDKEDDKKEKIKNELKGKLKEKRE